MPATALARIFAAAAYPVRIRILRNIAKKGTVGISEPTQGRGCTIGEAGLGLGIGLPTLSHHIKELEKAGFIQVKRHGREKRCWINAKASGEIIRFLMSLGPRRASYAKMEGVRQD